ncbi:MAG: RAMP superfamily CRISPR-associated protein [Acidobacteriota bacterium]
MKAGSRLILEAYEFKPGGDVAATEAITEWLSRHCLPGGDDYRYFREKMKEDTVLLSDDRFNYFARNATIVEPHVRIADETGAADDGGLFYTENLPPESLLVSLVMASHERKKGADAKEARDVLKTVMGGPGNGARPFEGSMIQVGGDSTTGRGQILLRFAAAEAGNG